MSDFRVDNHGSVMILWALSPEARQWSADYLPEDAIHWGSFGTVVEPRYILDLCQSLVEAGYTIE